MHLSIAGRMQQYVVDLIWSNFFSIPDRENEITFALNVFWEQFFFEIYSKNWNFFTSRIVHQFIESSLAFSHGSLHSVCDGNTKLLHRLIRHFSWRVLCIRQDNYNLHLIIICFQKHYTTTQLLNYNQSWRVLINKKIKTAAINSSPLFVFVNIVSWFHFISFRFDLILWF